MTRIRTSVVAISVGAIGAVLGAASAYDDGFGLMTMMAVIGAAFGLPIGAGISALSRALLRSRRDHIPGVARVDTEEQDRLRKQLEELRDYKAFSDDYYPGNPDPDARAVSGWKPPESRGSTR
jgi:hypothetical protein